MKTSSSEGQAAFLDKRRRLNRYWPWVGAFLLLVLLGLGFWLYEYSPMLINPNWVWDRLRSDTLAQDTQAMMAAMLPLMVLFSLSMAALIILLGFQCMRNERRLLHIIATQQAYSAGSS